MAIMLRRQLNDDEKLYIVKIHGRTCFATGHPIPDTDAMHFDHIRAFSDHGPTEVDNIAPMCETHNRQKGALPLADFRVKLRLNDFFSSGDALTLKHLLAYLKKAGDITDYGQSVVVNETDGQVRLDAASSTFTHALYTCPTTSWKYFYATLPVSLLDSDDDEDHKIGLQPRFLISEKVFDLYRHFQRHPVLQPSIGRVSQNRVLLFDGQHKIAALLWNGRKDFECKVYLSPDIKLVNETNIAAHDKFSQTRFYSSVMVLKLGTEFGAEFEDYKKLEDGSPKSEAGFMKFLDTSQSMIRADRNKRFRNYLYNSILQPKENQAARFVSTGNRSTDEKPLTMDMLHKSLCACFLYGEPVEDNLLTDAYKRDVEIENNIALMNMLYDLALCGWKPTAGPHDGNQRRLVRLFRSKAIMALAELVRDAVCGKLELVDAEDRARPFYRVLIPDDSVRIRKVIERLVNWNLWAAPANHEIDRVLADNKSAVKEWLRSHGLSTGYLMGAAE